jgi:hypothetical protein
VLDETDAPVPGVGVSLRSSGLELLDRGDSAGIARFKGLSAGAYEFTLYELDRDAWTVVRVEPLGERAFGDGCPAWEAVAESPGSGVSHRVELGDCMSSVAARYGFFADSLWNLPANAALRGRRADPNILDPGDVVEVPALRSRLEPAELGTRVVVRLRGVPLVLRVRLLDVYWEPLAHAPYLLEISTADGTPVPSRRGRTGADGFLVEPIPPSATTGTVVVGVPPEQFEIDLEFGFVNPADGTDGVQARLNNLGFVCGREDGVLDEATHEALRLFQRSRGLRETGEPDGETQSALRKLHTS